MTMAVPPPPPDVVPEDETQTEEPPPGYYVLLDLLKSKTHLRIWLKKLPQKKLSLCSGFVETALKLTISQTFYPNSQVTQNIIFAASDPEPEPTAEADVPSAPPAEPETEGGPGGEVAASPEAQEDVAEDPDPSAQEDATATPEADE